MAQRRRHQPPAGAPQEPAQAEAGGGPAIADPHRWQVDQYLREQQTNWRSTIIALAAVLFGGSILGTCSVATKTIGEQVAAGTHEVVELVGERARESSRKMDAALEQITTLQVTSSRALEVAQKAEGASQDAFTKVGKISRDIEEFKETVERVSNDTSRASEQVRQTARTATDAENQAKSALTTAQEASLKAAALSGSADQLERLRQDLQRALSEGGDVREIIAELLRGSLKNELKAAVSDVVQVASTPVGSIVAWPTNRIPDGWRLCNGDRMSMTAELWEVLRGRFGNPDTSLEPTGLLPDFRGYFLRGHGEDAGSGPLGQVQADSVGPHQHDVDLGTYDVARYDNGGDTDSDPNGARPNRIHVRGKTAVYNPQGETRPKNVAINWIIKTQ